MKRIQRLLLGLTVLTWATTATAQQFPMFLDAGAGDIRFRSHAFMSMISATAPQVVFYHDQGLSGNIYQVRADGSTGWLDHANALGYNAYALTMVGCGKAEPPPWDDLFYISEKAIYGVYQMGYGVAAQMAFAQGLSAAYVIKARATSPKASRTAVLLDAWGPPGSQTWPEVTVADVVKEQENLEDVLWHRWAMGPKPGKLTKNSALGRDGFEEMLGRYEHDQPPYWITLRTGFDGGAEVKDAANLAGWHVLLVQSPYRTREEIRREDELAKWLTEREVNVERLKLVDLDLPGISGLPMVDDRSHLVLEHFLTWSDTKLLAPSGL